MGKQAHRSNNNGGKSSQSFGRGDVTLNQVAFIVDQYLHENTFSDTRSAFRFEASSLLDKSSLNDAPQGLLSLEAILNEYISLKEQKVMVDHERSRLDHEKRRIQNLLQGMQNAMSVYNSSGVLTVPSIPAAAPKTMTMALPPIQPLKGSPSGLPVYKTPLAHPVSTPSATANTHLSSSTSPLTHYQPAMNKRKDSKALLDAPPLAKKPRGKSSISGKGKSEASGQQVAKSFPFKSSPKDCITIGSSQNGSTVAKCLFNLSTMVVPPNTSIPMTPPKENSSQSDNSISPLENSSQSDKSISPLENSSSAANCSTENTPECFTTTRCTVISSKRVTVSPFKQIAYSMERNHCITTTSSPVKSNLTRQSKRDHVKGRLDFDKSDDVLINSDKPNEEPISTSESEKEIDIFDMDVPSLDIIGPDFSFTDMLREFDLECEEIRHSCQSNIDASGSSPESIDGNVGDNQFVSEYSSTMTEVLSQKDMSTEGPESLTSVQSVTRCIKIISPVKNHGSPDQNRLPTNVLD